MIKTLTRSRIRPTLLVLLGAAAGCINVFKRIEPHPQDLAAHAAPGTATVWTSPVRAHLKDGSTVVYRRGASVDSRGIDGAGIEFWFMSDQGRDRVGPIPMDSLLAVETYDERTNVGTSAVVSIAATAMGAVATAALAVAIFGSCPTVYADTGAGAMLQAEGFSYAVSPLFEHRDIDPLTLRPGADGVLRLQLRNEALETHRINHIELIAVSHPVGTAVVPDQRGQVAVVGDLHPVRRAVDRAGRDVSEELRERDGRLFATAPVTLAAAHPGDLDDWVDLWLGALPPGDSVAVVLRLRNSLLNTVLLYDGMLSGRDAPDLLGVDLHRIATAVEFGQWYRRAMGMRVELGGREVYLPDVGPIAFRDVVVVLPRPAVPGASIRLRFVVDNWRIDQVAVAGTLERPAMELLPVVRVLVPDPADGGGPQADTAALTALAAPDGRYLETLPGQRMSLEFAPASAPRSPDDEIGYLIAWQGWYREWIRADWLARPRRSEPFQPGEEALFAAVDRWRSEQTDFEARFYASPVGAP